MATQMQDTNGTSQMGRVGAQWVIAGAVAFAILLVSVPSAPGLLGGDSVEAAHSTGCNNGSSDLFYTTDCPDSGPSSSGSNPIPEYGPPIGPSSSDTGSVKIGPLTPVRPTATQTPTQSSNSPSVSTAVKDDAQCAAALATTVLNCGPSKFLTPKCVIPLIATATSCYDPGKRILVDVAKVPVQTLKDTSAVVNHVSTILSTCPSPKSPAGILCLTQPIKAKSIEIQPANASHKNQSSGKHGHRKAHKDHDSAHSGHSSAHKDHRNGRQNGSKIQNNHRQGHKNQGKGGKTR